MAQILTSTLICLFILNSFLDCVEAETVLSKARELEGELFENYRRFVKPRDNQTHPVDVKYSAVVQQLVDVEVETQRVTLVFWMSMMWYDDFLKWDPVQFKDLRTIFVNPNRIWVPDIVIANRQDKNPIIEDVTQILAAVTYNGMVSWFKPMSVSVQCEMNTRNFPWDTQTCMFAIGSFNHFDRDIKISMGAISTGVNLIEHPEWSLVGTTPRNKWIPIHDHVTNQVQQKNGIYFEVYFARKPRFYVIIIVVPTILISLVSMFVFLLPNSSSEKITFSMSMMLSFYINLLTVANNIPNTSKHYPYIGYYYLMCIFLIASSLFQTALTLTMHFKYSDTSRAPLWLRTCVFRTMQLILKIKFLRHTLPGDLADCGDKGQGNVSVMTNEIASPKPALLNINRKMGDASTPSELQLKRLLNILGKFDSYRYEFDKRQHNKQKQSSVIAEWQLIAKVLDIIIGCIFFTVASILSVVCVMMSKHGP
ncbi:neuronal acetylcholine receptor subunit alpha-3-like [Symsagittifera roscoffensis]|uniref:neuronal acetylcholine receptor subunit alpha-3-like n=1 Tax=Symsagittifera roscoffensis TaxID=84072 RepID=UPI00307C36C3